MPRTKSSPSLQERATPKRRQISRYKNDRVTPSAEILIKPADAYEVSIDFFLRDDVPRVAVEAHDVELVQMLREVEALPDEDRAIVQRLIDAFLTKHKIKQLAAT